MELGRHTFGQRGSFEKEEDLREGRWVCLCLCRSRKSELHTRIFFRGHFRFESGFVDRDDSEESMVA